MSNLRTTERIEDAINFINNQLSVDEPTAASATTFPPADPFSLASQDQLAASVLNPLTSCHVQDAELNSSPDQNEMKIPSELISHCLATLFMIQVNHIPLNLDFTFMIFIVNLPSVFSVA